MGYFISSNGAYHEGDEVFGDTEVPQRPDAFHAWSGSAWVYAATETDYLAEVGRWLDATVQERFYDNIVSACSYAASTNPKFKAEADACIAWRDAVYVACYAALAAVQGGTMEQPTVEAFIASLPALTWPQEPAS